MRYCYSKYVGTSAMTNYNSLGLQNYVLTSKKDYVICLMINCGYTLNETADASYMTDYLIT